MLYYSIICYRFLILIFLNNFRNLFIFCINIHIDKVLQIEKKNKGVGLTPLELFRFVILEKEFWFLLILLNNFRIHFIFCINVDIDKVLLLDKNKDLEVNSFRVFSFVILEEVFWFLLLILLNLLNNFRIFSYFA